MSVSSGRTGAELAGIIGGYAPLDSGLLVPRAYLPQIAGLLHNMSASAAPTVNDDSGDGYGVGSMWMDTTNDRSYICLDATVGSAVWRCTTIGAVTTYTPTLTAATTNPTLGNGTLAGRYALIGEKLCWVRISWQFGSTSNAGSGEYSFALPFTTDSASSTAQALAGRLLDASSAHYVVAGNLNPSNSSAQVVVADGTGNRILSSSMPMTWATGDVVVIEGVYHIA